PVDDLDELLQIHRFPPRPKWMLTLVPASSAVRVGPSITFAVPDPQQRLFQRTEHDEHDERCGCADHCTDQDSWPGGSGDNHAAHKQDQAVTQPFQRPAHRGDTMISSHKGCSVPMVVFVEEHDGVSPSRPRGCQRARGEEPCPLAFRRTRTLNGESERSAGFYVEKEEHGVWRRGEGKREPIPRPATPRPAQADSMLPA